MVIPKGSVCTDKGFSKQNPVFNASEMIAVYKTTDLRYCTQKNMQLGSKVLEKVTRTRSDLIAHLNFRSI